MEEIVKRYRTAFAATYGESLGGYGGEELVDKYLPAFIEKFGEVTIANRFHEILEKSLGAFARLQDLGLLENATDTSRLRRSIIEETFNFNRVLHAPSILRAAKLLVEFQTEEPLGSEDHGFSEGVWLHLQRLTFGKVQFDTVNDNLWSDREAKTFKFWFTFRGKRYESELPQDERGAPPYSEIEAALNLALREHGIAEGFYGILDPGYDSGGTIFATLRQVALLEKEGWIGKVGYAKMFEEQSA